MSKSKVEILNAKYKSENLVTVSAQAANTDANLSVPLPDPIGFSNFQITDPKILAERAQFEKIEQVKLANKLQAKREGYLHRMELTAFSIFQTIQLARNAGLNYQDASRLVNPAKQSIQFDYQ